ncbi:beta-galactosidase [Planobispora siamensis]|uniref:Beta-galactosidase n=2 Tax=Planobispora siamensis TaxID=936338 RepID=A0A8J3WR43_9ACTN|nr:beta-galactosidase [Planobispora siamensis]
MLVYGDIMYFGGDYNPEQWSEDIWADDVARMREAGVNLVTVGVFSWASLEPEEGSHRFGWLDRVLGLLADNGIGVDLATATASPPPWFSAAYPQSLPVDADGARLWPGSRQAYCPSSPHYRAAAVRLARAMAEHYAGHPALRMWHIGNEYGCHVSRCYCDTSAAAFRDWLRKRYDLPGLNQAWGTRFWSQEYTSFEEVLPPRKTPSFLNPAHDLDFRRFSSAELLACHQAELEVLREVTPDIPVTTNFMAGVHWEIDYWQWVPHVDVVATDHYLRADDPESHIDLAFAADLTRGLAGGAPWLLMEHSTSAVNWQPRNIPKTPGQMRRNSLAHVARGSDGALFFQWRASLAGAERHHSGMIPHAGTDSRIWREVCELGADLGRLTEVEGSRVTAEVAIVFDWPGVWAQERPGHPSVDMTARDEIAAWHRALWRLGITADFVPPDGDLTPYRLVLLPAQYLLGETARSALLSYVEAGGTLVAGAYSGVADDNDRIWPGGYPGALREVLGVRMEEFVPLAEGGTVTLSDGSTGRIWREHGRAVTAEVIASYTAGDADPVTDPWARVLDGAPAITRNTRGEGTAWYVSTRLDDPSLTRLLTRITGEAGVHPEPGAVTGLELVRRAHPDGPSYLFAVNHGVEAVPLEATGLDLLTGEPFPGTVPAGGVAVIRES